MNPSQSVSDHYSRSDAIVGGLLEALKSHGVSADDLTAQILAGADEFHVGGPAATDVLLGSLGVKNGDRLLDIGCGIGGPARHVASATGCDVVGIDLTAAFVDAANELSRLVDLSDLTSFSHASAADLATLTNDPFDAAMMVHVGMNIADKVDVFRDIHRALRPDARLVIYDIMRISEGELLLPMPWASVAENSYVETPDEYTAALEAAGFVVESITQRSELAAATSDSPLTLRDLMGDEFPTMVKNLRRAIGAGMVAPTQICAVPA